MMSRVTRFACVLLFGLASSHCGSSKGDNDSNLNWGIFNNLLHVSSAGLLSLPPNSKVCVKGYRAQEAALAIKQWTDAIGRTPYLKSEAGCDNGTRTIDLRGPTDSVCQGEVAGFTNTVDRIHVCKEYPQNIITHILLHETGHMWGLCDQYAGGQGCQAGQVNPNTVMGGASGLTALTADDLAGIKYVTSQPNLGANKAWLALLKSAPTPAQQAPSTTKNAQAEAPAKTPAGKINTNASAPAAGRAQATPQTFTPGNKTFVDVLCQIGVPIAVFLCPTEAAKAPGT